ncbi:hypothetical protein ACFFVB_08365 [Formosa undariae]|uniref:DUF4878 domain-containing protein n=1 Tax=Formosa undariae TaxID=1325436 RepID=A0ABV5F0Z5_9FLAO
MATSFLHNDKPTLKKHTTAVAYANLTSIQEMFIEDKNSDINFKVVDQAIDGEIVWIKYTMRSDSKPGIFKLVKEDNQWKVDHNGPRERGPF